jgi:hypothetical protein
MRRCFFLLLAVLPLAFAPLPVPRPALSKEQEELLKSAEADMDKVRRLDEGGSDRRAVTAAERKKLCRSAGQKIDRLASALPRAPRATRVRAARLGAEAWRGAGQPAKALPYYKMLTGDLTAAKERIAALAELASCHLALGHPREAREQAKAMREELPRLDHEWRAAWEAWLEGLEGRMRK